METMDFEKLERYIDQFLGDEGRIDWDKWNYADGCVAVGARNLYQATGKDEFRDYVIRYADGFVAEDGKIRTYRPEDAKLDDILPGRAVLFAYEQTGQEKYGKAIGELMDQLKDQPRTPSGNYWHKKIYPNQVWLDGLYMAQPFRMAVDTRYGKKDNYLDICTQYANVRRDMRDPDTGLYYHGFDESRKAFWADPKTGCSRNFWLRAMGWYLMSLADTLEEMDRTVYDFMRPMQDQFKESLKALLAWANPDTGMFYQVINHPELAGKGNYLETSGSAMVAAAIFKACRMRLVLMEKYLPAAEKILGSLVEHNLKEREGRLVLTGTCEVAGLGPDPGRRDGSIGYYLSEPVKDDDKKGAAALFMAYAQYLLLKKWEVGERWRE